MPIATLAAYKAALAAPFQRFQDTKNSITTVAGRRSSHWLTQPFAGSAPGAAAVPTRATVGALGQFNAGGIQRLVQMAVSLGNNAYIVVCDRLSHQSGLSGTVATAQTTNLPTAALTRYTSGQGVIAALEIYTAVGTTQTTVTASYTNESGTPGQITESTPIGATAFNEANRIIPLPLAIGDTGVRAVASVTLAGTTGTAGNFGVTLFKPLFSLAIPNLGAQQFLFDGLLTAGGNLPEVLDDACLWYVVIPFTTSTGIWQSAFRLVEE